MQHRTAPNNGLVGTHEVIHGDDLYAVRLRGDDRLIDHAGMSVHSKHLRDGESPHVRIDYSHRMPLLSKGDRQIGCDRGLPDAALPAGDRYHPGGRAGTGDGDAALGSQITHQLAAIVIIHVNESNVDGRNAVNRGCCAFDPSGDRSGQGVAGNRYGDLYLNLSLAIHIQGPDHLELTQRAT